MIELSKQTCRNLNHSDNRLQSDDIKPLLNDLQPAWHIDTNKLVCCFTFDDYYQTIAFMNTVAQIAHQQNHHPDCSITYNSCTISYSTHSIDGISINDFICAAKINNTLPL